ncbi:hypothetical protein C0J45_1709 [Silurus meridionalis]|nr:hypothetical protein C0J45_1709 [Silurus meridionalis]
MKAYDRVPREELWYCMRQSGVSEKYVRVMQAMCEDSVTAAKCAVGTTDWFKVEVVLHQGSALNPFLFAVVMDRLTDEVKQESPWTLMFADDIVICAVYSPHPSPELRCAADTSRQVSREAEVRKTLCRVNPRKSAGPDNIPGRVLRECAQQLADVFTDIFNISLSSATVPTCLKTTTIIPVPKKSTVSCLNDYRPVALTPIVMKCFERLVMRHIKTQLPPALDPMQFAYPTHSSNYIIKFADDTTVVGLINKNNKSAYIEEVQWLTAWCGANNLSLNVDKTKELVVDFRRTQSDHSPLNIDGSSVEIIKSTKFLGVYLADNLTWSFNTSSINKKAQQRLYFLRRLWKAPPS